MDSDPIGATDGPRFDRAVPHDGYVWWYVDALSDDGQHAITLIAFIGSVFSPYYAWARRSGPADPHNHCALNVALYGRKRGWAMTERGRGALHRTAGILSIGPSALQWGGMGLTITIAERGMPVPRSLRGTVRLYPTVTTPHSFALDPGQRHRWSPLAPIARVEVDMQSPALRWSGAGYFDMNAGDAPLERDFVRWDWSCARTRDGAAVLYDVTPRHGGDTCLGVSFDASGGTTEFEPPQRVRLPSTGWQVPRTTRADNEQARVVATYEDSPFYARSAVASRLLGEDVVSMHESLALNRFQTPVVQMLLPFRMPRIVGRTASSTA